MLAFLWKPTIASQKPSGLKIVTLRHMGRTQAVAELYFGANKDNLSNRHSWN